MRDYWGGRIILTIYEIQAGLLERRELKRGGNIRVNTVPTSGEGFLMESSISEIKIKAPSLSTMEKLNSVQWT